MFYKIIKCTIDISITQNASHGKDRMFESVLCARACAAEVRTLRFVTPVVFNYFKPSLLCLCSEIYYIFPRCFMPWNHSWILDAPTRCTNVSCWRISFQSHRSASPNALNIARDLSRLRNRPKDPICSIGLFNGILLINTLILKNVAKKS